MNKCYFCTQLLRYFKNPVTIGDRFVRKISIIYRYRFRT